MTREEAIHLRPGTKVEYQCILGFAALWCVGLLLDVLFPDYGQRPDMVSLTGAFFAFLPAAQAAERLFWPISAAQRTANLSPRAHSIIKGAGFTLPLLAMVWIAFDFISSHRHHQTGIFWIFWVYGIFFADLLGESPFAQRSIPPDQLHIAPSHEYLQPIQSEHWGRRNA